MASDALGRSVAFQNVEAKENEARSGNDYAPGCRSHFRNCQHDRPREGEERARNDAAVGKDFCFVHGRDFNQTARDGVQSRELSMGQSRCRSTTSALAAGLANGVAVGTLEFGADFDQGAAAGRAGWF